MIVYWLPVLIPILLYVILFSIELVFSFRRLTAHAHIDQYFQISWEITHTLLIVGVSTFLWVFSDLVPLVGSDVYTLLLFVGVLFFLRAITYALIFYVWPGERHPMTDWLFACSHVGLFALLTTIIIKVGYRVAHTSYHANTELLPYVWPGVILIIAVSLVPVIQGYMTWKEKKA